MNILIEREVLEMEISLIQTSSFFCLERRKHGALIHSDNRQYVFLGTLPYHRQRNSTPIISIIFYSHKILILINILLYIDINMITRLPSSRHCP